MDKETLKAFREVAENARRHAAELANSCHPAETTEVLWADAKIGELPPLKRWNVAITYDNGQMDQHDIGNLSILPDIVLRGPNSDHVAKIEIVINPVIDRKN
jgi:hypothetical protein